MVAGSDTDEWRPLVYAIVELYTEQGAHVSSHNDITALLHIMTKAPSKLQKLSVQHKYNLLNYFSKHIDDIAAKVTYYAPAIKGMPIFPAHSGEFLPAVDSAVFVDSYPEPLTTVFGACLKDVNQLRYLYNRLNVPVYTFVELMAKKGQSLVDQWSRNQGQLNNLVQYIFQQYPNDVAGFVPILSSLRFLRPLSSAEGEVRRPAHFILPQHQDERNMLLAVCPQAVLPVDYEVHTTALIDCGLRSGLSFDSYFEILKGLSSTASIWSHELSEEVNSAGYEEMNASAVHKAKLLLQYLFKFQDSLIGNNSKLKQQRLQCLSQIPCAVVTEARRDVSDNGTNAASYADTLDFFPHVALPHDRDLVGNEMPILLPELVPPVEWFDDLAIQTPPPLRVVLANLHVLARKGKQWLDSTTRQRLLHVLQHIDSCNNDDRSREQVRAAVAGVECIPYLTVDGHWSLRAPGESPADQSAAPHARSHTPQIARSNSPVMHHPPVPQHMHDDMSYQPLEEEVPLYSVGRGGTVLSMFPEARHMYNNPQHHHHQQQHHQLQQHPSNLQQGRIRPQPTGNVPYQMHTPPTRSASAGLVHPLHQQSMYRQQALPQRKRREVSSAHHVMAGGNNQMHPPSAYAQYPPRRAQSAMPTTNSSNPFTASPYGPIAYGGQARSSADNRSVSSTPHLHYHSDLSAGDGSTVLVGNVGANRKRRNPTQVGNGLNQSTDSVYSNTMYHHNHNHNTSTTETTILPSDEIRRTLTSIASCLDFMGIENQHRLPHPPHRHIVRFVVPPANAPLKPTLYDIFKRVPCIPDREQPPTATPLNITPSYSSTVQDNDNGLSIFNSTIKLVFEALLQCLVHLEFVYTYPLYYLPLTHPQVNKVSAEVLMSSSSLANITRGLQLVRTDPLCMTEFIESHLPELNTLKNTAINLPKLIRTVIVSVWCSPFPDSVGATFGAGEQRRRSERDLVDALNLLTDRRLTGCARQPIPNNSAEWLTVCDAFYVGCASPTVPTVISIERFSNPNLLQKWIAARSTLHAPHYPTVLKFYSETGSLANTTLSDGLPASSGMSGLQFTSDVYSTPIMKHPEGLTRVLILYEVAVGKSMLCQNGLKPTTAAINAMQAGQYDSLQAASNHPLDGVTVQDVLVFNGALAYPKYLIAFAPNSSNIGHSPQWDRLVLSHLLTQQNVNSNKQQPKVNGNAIQALFDAPTVDDQHRQQQQQEQEQRAASHSPTKNRPQTAGPKRPIRDVPFRNLDDSAPLPPDMSVISPSPSPLSMAGSPTKPHSKPQLAEAGVFVLYSTNGEHKKEKRLLPPRLITPVRKHNLVDKQQQQQQLVKNNSVAKEKDLTNNSLENTSSPKLQNKGKEKEEATPPDNKHSTMPTPGDAESKPNPQQQPQPPQQPQQHQQPQPQQHQQPQPQQQQVEQNQPQPQQQVVAQQHGSRVPPTKGEETEVSGTYPFQALDSIYEADNTMSQSRLGGQLPPPPATNTMLDDLQYDTGYHTAPPQTNNIPHYRAMMALYQRSSSPFASRPQQTVYWQWCDDNLHWWYFPAGISHDIEEAFMGWEDGADVHDMILQYENRQPGQYHTFDVDGVRYVIDFSSMVQSTNGAYLNHVRRVLVDNSEGYGRGGSSGSGRGPLPPHTILPSMGTQQQQVIPQYPTSNVPDHMILDGPPQKALHDSFYSDRSSSAVPPLHGDTVAQSMKSLKEELTHARKGKASLQRARSAQQTHSPRTQGNSTTTTPTKDDISLPPKNTQSEPEKPKINKSDVDDFKETMKQMQKELEDNNKSTKKLAKTIKSLEEENQRLQSRVQDFDGKPTKPAKDSTTCILM